MPKKMNELLTHIKPFNHRVAPGTFIMWKSQNRVDIGRIVGEAHGKSLVSINVFVREGDDRLSCAYTNGSRLIDDTIQHIVEVIQTPMMVEVNPDKVKDLAFVFRPDDVKGRAHQGMTNLFICRKRSGNTRVDKLYSFPVEDPAYTYPTCYASMIWYGLERVRKAVRKVLNRKTEKQGSYQSASSVAYIASETWEYLNRYLKDFADKKIKRTLKRVRCEMTAGITLQSFRDKEKWDCVRLETNADLQGLCNILGEAILT